MSVDLFESVVECGCAAKVPAQQLSEILNGLVVASNPAVVVGPETLDDAGVFRLSDGHYLVQTVDFFPPVARDPKTYGRVAAANSISDVYAMGGKPLTALAMVCIPARLISAGVLNDVLKGANEILNQAGCALLGGHSVLDQQTKFGLAVTGVIDPQSMFTNRGARAGDLLILTKPIGTGATVMAIRAGVASDEQETEANRVMAVLNQKAAELAREFNLGCATDVTGFGLLGHALQLARASGVALEFDVADVPLLDGVLSFAEQGFLSAAAYNNRSYAKDAVAFDDSVTLAEQDVLFDPQTSGGLLLCCPAAQVQAFLSRARDCLDTACGVVGRVLNESDGPMIRVTKKYSSANEPSRETVP